MGRGREREEEDQKFQPHDRQLKSLQGKNQVHDQPQKCPRCESINTKFCYYNNYSLSQPRYFCKGCRRYWTQGGTLRNVPVGGGYPRGKRPKISTSSTSASIENLKNIIEPDVTSSSPMIKNSFQPPKIIESGDVASPYFRSGGYFDRSFSFGHEMGSSANLSFSHGGLCVNHLFQSEEQKQRQIQSTQIYQMDERGKAIPSFYASLQNWSQPFAEAGVATPPPLIAVAEATMSALVFLPSTQVSGLIHKDMVTTILKTDHLDRWNHTCQF